MQRARSSLSPARRWTVMASALALALSLSVQMCIRDRDEVPSRLKPASPKK